MSTSARAALVASLAAWLVTASACAGFDREPAPPAAGAEALRHITLAPANLVVPMPAEFVAVTGRISRQIRIDLEARGRMVSMLDEEKADLLWAGARARVEAQGVGAPGFERAVRIFALGAAEQSDADGVLIPALVYRPANQRYGNARWDGVIRSVPVPLQSFEGLVGASLHVLLYAADGEHLYEGFGGLELTHVFVEEKQRLDVRDDLLREQKYIREGVAIALDPFFGARP